MSDYGPRGLRRLVGSPNRMGHPRSLASPLVVAGRFPPPEVMRQLPTDAAIFIAMTALGYDGPDYRMGKSLAKSRRALEKLWAEAATHSRP